MTSDTAAVAAHEQTETFVEHDLIAEHVQRTATKEFEHNKAVLVALVHGRCWCGTDLCDYARPIEAHHIFEWSGWNKMDPVRVKATLLTFDPYGFSAKLAAQPIESPDDVRNLILLCDLCHRGVDLGAHHVLWPTLWERKGRRDGENITVGEEQVRAKLAAVVTAAETVAVQVPAGSTVVVQTPQEPQP